MELVVDTSVFIAILLNEPSRVELLRNTRGAILLAPPIVEFEITNALSAMLKRGRLTIDKALAASEQFEQIPVRILESDAAEVLRVANACRIYAYDACFLEGALRYGVPLLSLDRSQLNHAKNLQIQTMELNV